MEPEQGFGDSGSGIIKKMKGESYEKREVREAGEEKSPLQTAGRLKSCKREREERGRESFDVEIGQFETVNLNFSASTETPWVCAIASLKECSIFAHPYYLFVHFCGCAIIC